MVRIRCMLAAVSAILLSFAACKSQPPAPTSSPAAPSRQLRNPSNEDIRSALEQMPADDRLRTFRSRAEFEAYRKHIKSVATSHGLWWLTQALPGTKPVLLASAETQPCDPNTEPCAEGLQEVVTTGQRVSRPASITNNQVADVDEGDIVKSWGRFLVVLHDARLFTVDLGKSPGQLRLADRVNAYQESDTDAWYDELLIKDNHVLVTGYSYDAGQAEYSVFDIDDAGRLKLASRFFIKSEDYFSGTNYASRLVGGRLVIYNPIELSNFDAANMPQVRSWRPGRGFSRWRPLLEATDIYRPVDRSLNPMIHVVSVCPILSNATGECDSRAIVAARNREQYVSAQAAYLWVSRESEEDYVWSTRPHCADNPSHALPPAKEATVYRLPFDSEAATAARTHGEPPDQFAMEERPTTFYSLVRRLTDACTNESARPLELFAFPLRMFSDRPRAVPERYIHPQPQVGEGYVSVRFADRYLNYGAGQGWWQAYRSADEDQDGDEEAKKETRRFVSVPLRNPDHPVQQQLTHSVERVELFGDNVAVFGVNATRSLGVSMVDLRAAPIVAATLDVPDTLESEGRSHAFNAQPERDGSGVFGLPTGMRTGERSRYGFDETQDQVTYFTADKSLSLRTPGSLQGNRLPDNAAYKCEVSCVDWYGNTRPIFYDNRMFALIGREFAEGRIEDGRVVELARLDLTLEPGR